MRLKSFVVICSSFLLFISGTLCGTNTMIKLEFNNLAKVLFWEESPTSFNSGGIKFFTGKKKINSAERWFDIQAKFNTQVYPLEGTELTITLKEVGSDKIFEVKKSKVKESALLIRIDMRSLGKELALVTAEWKTDKGEVLGTGSSWITAESITSLSLNTKIPVKIDIPKELKRENSYYPVRFGVPFPRGAVWQIDGLKVVDSQGKEQVSQLEVAGRWAEEGAVKWVWVDALVSGNTEEIYLTLGGRSKNSSPSTPLKVEKTSEGYRVSTGVAEYMVGQDGGLIKEAKYNGRIISREGEAKGLYVIDQKGRLGKASKKDATMELEAAGPLSGVIRIEGFYRTYTGEELCRHITRLGFTAGSPEVNATHTLIITRNTNDIWFKDIGWELETLVGQGVKGVFGVYPANDRNYVDEKVDIIKESPRRGVWSTGALKEYSDTSDYLPEKVFTVSLNRGDKISMYQKEGVYLGVRPTLGDWPRDHCVITYLKGKNLFEITRIGKKEVLHTGERMGDWAGVEGSLGGFMFSCKDTAAQHPKEFEVTENLINFKLFTSSTGKELNFKMETVMENWGMLPKEEVAKYYKDEPKKLAKLDGYLEFIKKHETNAAGWAKTHEILISPFKTRVEAGIRSGLHSRQVYAYVNPDWIGETSAIIPIHSKSVEKFPLAEKVIDTLFWGKMKEGKSGPIGGFIDYQSGPHLLLRYTWRNDPYTLRSEAWYLYARSGEREYREISQGTNRAFIDNNFVHWQVSPRHPLGLMRNEPVSSGTLEERTRKSDLPLYWEGESTNSYADGLVNLDKALLDYYLTGYRRAGDILRNFANIAVKDLTVEMPQYRTFHAIRHLTQAYELTWEPRLRELIYEMVEHKLYDPEGEILLTKARPYRSSTYKTATDGDVLIILYELFGDDIFYKMAKAMSTFNWNTSSLVPGDRSTGWMGYFLFKETEDPSIIARFDYGRRRLVGDLLSSEGKNIISLQGQSILPKYLKGLPFAMNVLREAEKENKKIPSWVAFKSPKLPTSIFVIKPGETIPVSHYAKLGKDETSMEITIRKEASLGVKKTPKGTVKLAGAGGMIYLQPHALFHSSWIGHDLHSVTEKSNNVASVKIPKDAPGGVYELKILNTGVYFIALDKYTPLSIYAPEGWATVPMNPPVRVYFKLPENTEKGRIFFQKKTSLFTPTGEPFKEGAEFTAWVDLPSDMPGLWSFESIDAGDIKTENIPPFFSMGNPDLYLEYTPK